MYEAIKFGLVVTSSSGEKRISRGTRMRGTGLAIITTPSIRKHTNNQAFSPLQGPLLFCVFYYLLVHKHSLSLPNGIHVSSSDIRAIRFFAQIF